MLKKVISGGQTGADMAGLITAYHFGIKTGGTAPKNFKTDDGINLDLGYIYGLNDEGGYKFRTIKNICNSDGTLVFLIHHGKGGTSKTIGYCKYGKWCDSFDSCDNGFRPILVLNSKDMKLSNIKITSEKIIKWIKKNKINILNIAGHRNTTAFQKPFFKKQPYNYEQRVVDILSQVFKYNI